MCFIIRAYRISRPLIDYTRILRSAKISPLLILLKHWFNTSSQTLERIPKGNTRSPI